MLQLKNIDVWINDHHILHNLSCTINKGDFIVIVGTNGSGKTTLFDTIAGKRQPTQGTITLNDKNITHMNELARAPFISRIFQNTSLNSVGSMTVEQNLAMAHYSRRSAKLVNGMHAISKEHIKQVVHDLGMESSILHKKMNQLSGGQRQLIAFAMTTQLTPKLLLLDEPTAALDPQAATKLLKHASTFIKQHTLTTLLITHDPYIALSIGNKIWVLDQGVIAKQFEGNEKKDVDANQLIGHIDYTKLASLH